MTLNPNARMEETQNGTEVYNVDPLIVKSHYEIDYIHSYAQDSEFFRALGKKKLMGSKCKECGYTVERVLGTRTKKKLEIAAAQV